VTPRHSRTSRVPGFSEIGGVGVTRQAQRHRGLRSADWEAAARRWRAPPRPDCRLPAWRQGRFRCLRRHPIRLVVYDNEEMSEEAWATWERNKGKLYDSASLRHYDEIGWMPLYEDATGWDVARSEYVIDYNGDDRIPSFGGIWRVRQERAFVPLSSSKKHRLILLVAAPFGLRFPRAEQNELGRQIKRALAQENCEPDKNGHYLDLALNEAGKLLWPG
jgi:hypothetical protein